MMALNGTEYEFRYKPGDPMRAPLWNIPHQPRLDWQMWFAALETCDENPWLSRLFVGLVNDEPAVLALLQDDPFGTEPPRAVRAVAYDYRFTDLATLRQTGAWWRRRPLGLYCPPVWASPSGPSARRGEGGEAVRTADGSSVPANVGAAQRAFLVGDSVLGDVDGQPVAAPGLANDLQQPLGVDFPAEVARSPRRAGAPRDRAPCGLRTRPGSAARREDHRDEAGDRSGRVDRRPRQDHHPEEGRQHGGSGFADALRRCGRREHSQDPDSGDKVKLACKTDSTGKEMVQSIEKDKSSKTNPE
jgi:Lipase maturation factor